VLILAIVVVTAAMDIGAYSVGRTWGRTALAPILSPNKSVEGLVGGIAACIGAAAVVGYLIDPFDLKSGLALGAVICLVAPVGDLAESMIKRSLGVKDMGAVLPGHGGILDRVDAFLFVLPAAWVLLQTIGLLG
jgi:phosphatidate cytidylyltransferase